MNEFLGFFLDEAVDILVEWEKISLRLEQDSSAETKDELYRAAHNLKSGSGAVGLDEFHHLVHAVEDLISVVMGQEGAIDAAIIRIFLDTQSTLVAWVERLKSGDGTVPVSELAAIQTGLVPFLGNRTTGPKNGAALPESVDLPSEATEPHATQPGSIREDTSPSASEALSSKAGDPSPEKKAQTASPSAPAAKPQETIRVAANKLDNLIELVGELATQQAIVWHGRQLGSLDSENCDNAIHLIQKIAKDLQGLSLSLRLQPLQGLFQRLERTIRDLARSQDKRINVVLKGDEVELDRSVAERIADALTHVVRNAIDHGVERSDDRLNAGKEAFATIQLEATPAASGVLIRIIDDGRGLNTERIRTKAIERGLISASTQMAESDIHRLIFHAGLSTAEKLTDVSGRGVGMDVVKTSVENIGGSIQLSSVFGKGTTFSISLPATLSIVDALLVNAGSNLYALPLQDVAEIIDLNEVDLQMMPGGNRLLRLRSSVIPLEDLAAHLPPDLHPPSSPHSSPSGNATMQPAILVRSGESLLAFRVESLAGQQLVTVRGLPTAIANIPGYSGGTILGDGNPCVVLNLLALASRHFENIHRGTASVAAQTPAIQSKFEESDLRYLIMEQSGHVFATSLMTVREILQNIRCENLMGNADTHKRYIAVRGELIPIFDLTGYTDAGDNHTFVVTSDGKRAFGVDRILAVCSLDVVESHNDGAPDDGSGILGFRRFEEKYIPLIDLDRALHLAPKMSSDIPSEGRTAS